MKFNDVPVFCYASGIASPDMHCGEGLSEVLSSSEFAHQFLTPQIVTPQSQFTDKTAEVRRMCLKLAEHTYQVRTQQKRFLTLGGDHTAAIGTWHGVARALQKPLGLIWIDAHLDSHTPQTTITGNLHGMPAAILLGHGKHELTALFASAPVLQPSNLCFIGVRSYEIDELNLLRQLGVRIYEMQEIEQRGLSIVWQEAIAHLQKNTAGYGITFDLDAIDPTEAPAVTTSEPNGLHLAECLPLLASIQHDTHLLGCEIVEYNRHNDVDDKTLKVIRQLINIFFP